MNRPRRLSFGLGAPAEATRARQTKPESLLGDLAPRTPLARAQLLWPAAAGETIAANAEPVAERDGVLTIACASAAWAQELDLMQDKLLAALQEQGAGESVRKLRFTADLNRHG